MKKPEPKPKLEADEIDRISAEIYMAGPRDFKPEDHVIKGERHVYGADRIKFTSRLIREFIKSRGWKL